MMLRLFCKKGRAATARQKLGTRSSTRVQQSASAQRLSPGDEAARGTPGTSEGICPHCHGSGRIGVSSCPNCGGSGKINKAIGGA
jgi:DnaJ-class molecular chaperone